VGLTCSPSLSPTRHVACRERCQGAFPSPPSTHATRCALTIGESRKFRAAHVRRPPAGVSFSLMQRRSEDGIGSRHASDEQQGWLLNLRFLRESVRALASISGTEWDVGAGREIDISGSRLDGTCGWHTVRVAAARLSAAGEATLSSPRLPSAMRQLADRLTVTASRAAALMAFGSALASGSNTPSPLRGTHPDLISRAAALGDVGSRAVGLHGPPHSPPRSSSHPPLHRPIGLGEAILAELAQLHAVLWRTDDAARYAQAAAIRLMMTDDEH
jgi:hypothetical protein